MEYWSKSANPKVKNIKGRSYRAYIGRTSFANILPASLSFAFLILSNTACNSAFCYCGMRLTLYYLDTHVPIPFGPLPHIRGGGHGA